MIGNLDPTVLVHIPIEPCVMRIQGAERKVFRLAQGFCMAEYSDGNIFHLSNPFEEWLLSVNTNSGGQGTGEQYTVYFVFEPEGKRGNPGENDDSRSLTDIATVL